MGIAVGTIGVCAYRAQPVMLPNVSFVPPPMCAPCAAAATCVPPQPPPLLLLLLPLFLASCLPVCCMPTTAATVIMASRLPVCCMPRVPRPALLRAGWARLDYIHMSSPVRPACCALHLAPAMRLRSPCRTQCGCLAQCPQCFAAHMDGTLCCSHAPTTPCLGKMPSLAPAPLLPQGLLPAVWPDAGVLPAPRVPRGEPGGHHGCRPALRLRAALLPD
jgi:hypothetical protein